MKNKEVFRMDICRKPKQPLVFLWLLVLLGYWTVIVCINLSGSASLYCTDMYTDMMYAEAVVKSGSLFPGGWVFGNQLYVAATPVLAALLLGITGDPALSMGLAATLMGLGVIASFSWMLRPVFRELHQRLAAVIIYSVIYFHCKESLLCIIVQLADRSVT